MYWIHINEFLSILHVFILCKKIIKLSLEDLSDHTVFYWYITCTGFFFTAVWSRQKSFHHYHQLVWNRADKRRPGQAVPPLWGPLPLRSAAVGQGWWLWSSQTSGWHLRGKWGEDECLKLSSCDWVLVSYSFCTDWKKRNCW